ncbi:hypothetical protein [Spirillospora sp. CA-294931]|uniref:hypothetical protein n=1 Tax=Spirillospora sp. CA-294931 TaxID=3240042 RepID=UPI003D91882D
MTEQGAGDREARLREIDEDLARLRAELGEPGDEPRDYGEAGQDLNARAEQGAQIEALENERRRLTSEPG